MKTKICTKCKKELSISEFSKGNDKKGFCYICKKCCNVYHQTNRKRILKRMRIYQQNHKEELKEYNKIYDKKRYLKNREEILKQSKKYRRDNKEQIKIRNKNYNESHKKEIAIQCKKYNQEHKEQINQYINNRLKTDINYKITHYLRTRLTKALKYSSKLKTTVELIGCSVEELKTHLASKFTKNMSFDNYGKWHIDHIKPCASFDLSKPEEQLKCFNYTNLQPLWAKDNLSKGDK
jgi:signal recognition particle GTPase